MSHRVHGPEGDDIRPDWPPLSPAELEHVAAAYGLGAVRGTPWVSPRPLSAAALVQAGARRVFVKRHHHSVRTATDLLEEHRFMGHLRARGIPVPEVLVDRDGVTAHARGDWTFEVHAAAQGRDLYRDTASWTPLADLQRARAAGAMLGRLHEASGSYGAPQRGTHILVARDDLLRAVDPMAALEAQLSERPGLAAYLGTRTWREDFRHCIAPRHARLQPRLARQAVLWTHNDWHASNLCWGADDHVADVLDFGLCSPTSALFDLATAIERNAIAWLRLDLGADAAHPRTASALIAGYREHHPLTEEDLDTLADLLPLVHVEFALSEIEYFHAITRSPRHADIAYDDFLIGHARWFDTAAAQPLLRAIREIPAANG